MNSSLDYNPKEVALGATNTTVKGMRTWHPIRIAILIMAGMVLFGLGFLCFKIVEISGNVYNGTKKTSFFSQLSQVVNSKSVVLKGTERDRINILLLGIGGGDHDGPNLTDTNIIVSIQPSTEQVAMVSFPRDMYVPIPGFGYNRLNAAYAFGEEWYEGGKGIETAENTITEISGQPIDYYVRVDFGGFTKAIDDLGGVDINVPNGFYDYNKNVTFEAGQQHMNGEQALAYARARYVDGPEGGDFARAARQQLVIKAMRDQIVKTDSLGDLLKVVDAITSFGNQIKTDITPAEAIAFYKLTKDLDTADIISQVVDEESTGLLYGDMVMMGGVGASVLRPTNGDFSKISALIENIFSVDLTVNENATIEVQNGSTTVGVGSAAADEIPMTVISVVNAANKDYTDTVIVDYTGGTMPHARDYLENKFGVTCVSSDSVDIPRLSNADFVVVIGSVYAAEISN